MQLRHRWSCMALVWMGWAHEHKTPCIQVLNNAAYPLRHYRKDAGLGRLLRDVRFVQCIQPRFFFQYFRGVYNTLADDIRQTYLMRILCIVCKGTALPFLVGLGWGWGSNRHH